MAKMCLEMDEEFFVPTSVLWLWFQYIIYIHSDYYCRSICIQLNVTWNKKNLRHSVWYKDHLVNLEAYFFISSLKYILISPEWFIWSSKISFAIPILVFLIWSSVESNLKITNFEPTKPLVCTKNWTYQTLNLTSLDG